VSASSAVACRRQNSFILSRPRRRRSNEFCVGPASATVRICVGMQTVTSCADDRRTQISQWFRRHPNTQNQIVSSFPKVPLTVPTQISVLSKRDGR
jgi:hypothetical protein